MKQTETCNDETGKMFHKNHMILSDKQEETSLKKITHDKVKPSEPLKTTRLQI